MMPRPRSWMLGAVAGLGTAWMIIESGLPSAAVKPVPKEENPRELYTIIENQIAAIRRDDFPTAYAFAAQGIRTKFPVAAFREMVRKTYPQLTRSRRVNYGQTQFAAHIRASALIYVNDGQALSPMIYAFVKENGQWKIDGVQMLQSSSESLDFSGPET